MTTIFAHDGNWLYQKGLENKKIDQGLKGNYIESSMYVAYIFGIADEWGGLLVCPSSGVKYRQIIDIVFKYLAEHPEKREKPAFWLIINALQKVWPCHHKLKVEDVISKLYEIEKFAKGCKEKKEDMSCYLLAQEYDKFDKTIFSIPIYKTICKKYKEEKNNITAVSCKELKKKADSYYIFFIGSRLV